MNCLTLNYIIRINSLMKISIYDSFVVSKPMNFLNYIIHYSKLKNQFIEFRNQIRKIWLFLEVDNKTKSYLNITLNGFNEIIWMKVKVKMKWKKINESMKTFNSHSWHHLIQIFID